LGFVTATLLVRDANPVAVTRVSAAGGAERVLVTVAGTTAYDAQGRLVPVTPASAEAYDAQSLAFLGRFELGLAGLSGTRPAVGRDGAGHEVAFFASSVRGEAYLLRLEGLYSAVVDPARVAVLRGPSNGIPIDPTLAGGPGGNVAGIALSSDGRTLVVSGFGDLFAYPSPRPGRMYALSLPYDLVADSSFPRGFLPGTSSLATAVGRTLGPCLIAALHPEGPEVFVLVGGAISGTTWLGEGPGSLGTLRTWGRIR
jgi:hypothetical protein